MKRIFKHEDTPLIFQITWLIAIWKRKGSALDLNMMRYIHTKHWVAKLCEALVCGSLPKHTNWGDTQIIKCRTPGVNENLDENKVRPQGRGYNTNFRYGEILR